MQMFVFGSPPMCFRSSHPASFLRATCPSWPPTFWTGSPAFLLTSWSSSPPCNPHRWDQSHYGCFAKNLQESRRKQIFFPPNEVDREHPIISPSTFLFVINFFFFLLLLSGIFVLLKKTQGWNKPEWVLLDHFLLYFLFIEVLFLCMEMLPRQNQTSEQNIVAHHISLFVFYVIVMLIWRSCRFTTAPDISLWDF